MQRERKALLEGESGGQHVNKGAQQDAPKHNAPLNKPIPAVSTQLQQESLSPASFKRNRTRGGTPPDCVNASQIRKIHDSQQNRTQSTPTLAQVVSDANLLIAVFDMPVPGIVVPFTKEKYAKLYETINTFLFAALDKLHHVPTFSENSFVRGVMRIRCSTPASKSWLECAIPYIQNMWENMKLSVTEFDKIPSPNKILGLFPNCHIERENICK